MVLVSVRLLVALAVCWVGMNKYGLVGADLDGCYAKCPTDVEGNRDFYCDVGCRYIINYIYSTKASCESRCNNSYASHVSTTLDALRCSWGSRFEGSSSNPQQRRYDAFRVGDVCCRVYD